jgi:hypothetical protein
LTAFPCDGVCAITLNAGKAIRASEPIDVTK